MTDLSKKDAMYFTGKNTYNCPYCNRNCVLFTSISCLSFDEQLGKETYIYKIRCKECEGDSIHFSKIKMNNNYNNGDSFDQYCTEGTEIDDLFFWHKPNKFFLLDESIDKKIRELFEEAQQSLDGNLLTGASACIRKILYTLLSKEECLERNGNKTLYADSFKKLKEKHPYVDVLEFSHGITQLVSDNLHEDSWDKRDPKKIKFLLGIIQEILFEMYVLPNLKKEKRKDIQKLLSEVSSK